MQVSVRRPMSILAQAKLSSGDFNLATQRWSAIDPSISGRNVLALHGWLDNSASFSQLAPRLIESGTVNDFVAIDLPGHGMSSHFEGPFQHVRHVGVVKGVLDELGWKKDDTVVVGHSMGGGIAMLFAGSFQESLSKLIMIDAFGPYTSTADKAPNDLRKAILSEEKLAPQNRMYPTLGEAISARVRIVATYPGGQSISKQAAEAIVRRGACLQNGSEDESTQRWQSLAGFDTTTGGLIVPESAGPVSFRYDSRLLLPSATYLTKDQADSFAEQITCPVLLVQATSGWPVKNEEYADRKRILEEKNLLEHRLVEGSHHLHIDPDTAPQVADIISNFVGK